jgi:pilus assembly protein CpaF
VSAAARIEVELDELAGAHRSLSFEATREIWVGRDERCDVLLAFPNVSRRHLKIAESGGVLTVEDHSSNGSLLDGTPLRAEARELPLGRGEVQVGPVRVRVSLTIAEQAKSCDSVSLEPNRRAIRRKLLEHLDLAGGRLDATPPSELRAVVREALGRIVTAAAPELSAESERRKSLLDELTDEALGLGPLERLLADDSVSEIMVVDPKTIFVERRGRLELTGLSFTDDDSVRAVIERIVAPLGRRIDESTPIVDARLRDGSRVNAVIPPLSLRGPCITIRKFSKQALRMRDLVAFGSVSAAMAELLERAVQLKRNIVISGGTGSGKTTLLNVLSAAIPEGERIVTIEDAAELKLSQLHVVGLEGRPPNLEGKGEYSIRDLLKNALRMRPDRIIVGECRGPEAIDMLQAMNTGHDGSLTTTHANSPREAVARIETLCLMAGLDLPLRAVRQQIANSIHLIVQQTRCSIGARRVTSIAEVAGLDDDGGVVLHELYKFRKGAPGDATAGAFVPTGRLSSFALAAAPAEGA